MGKINSYVNRIRIFIVSFRPIKRIYIVYHVGKQQNIQSQIPIEYKIITYENVEDVLSFRDEAVIKNFKNFLNKGHVGLYGYFKNKVVVHGWAILNSSSKKCLINEYFILEQQTALIHFCSVDPKYRGKKIYQSFLTHFYNKIKGYNIFIDANDWNIPAQKAIISSGANYRFTLITIWFRYKSRLRIRVKYNNEK